MHLKIKGVKTVIKKKKRDIRIDGHVIVISEV